MQPFSIPVQITLQGSRRRQGRTAFPASGKKRETDCSDGDPLDVHKRLSSTMLLGFAMMGFSVLMFFLLGITILKPFMLSAQREESTCTAIHTDIMDDWLDCAFTCGVHRCGQGKCPCLRKALLHYNEEAVQINPKHDVTDCRVKEKQTLTISDEHKQ
uniref:Calcium-activated potassium channel subunit beta n=1 Tax=Colobus angolensis palliatus TaxID=336983 RepID=A0A2K5IEC7_COLAP